MTDTTDQTTLSASDVALMRQLIAWRKAEGIDFVKRKVYGAPYWVRYAVGDRPRQEVWYQEDAELPLVMTTKPKAWKNDDYHEVEVASLTQAVDILVAYGYLPTRLSSAYRAGWDARYEWLAAPVRISGADGNDLRPAHS